jgi:hypothetical protein
MRRALALQRRGLCVPVLLICFAGLAPHAGAQDVYLNRMKANRILFFGNSITTHAPKPEIGWKGHWGMAASDPEHDYVHVLTGKIARAAGATPTIMATMNAEWEWNYMQPGYDWKSLQPQLDFKPDIVVVAIGENVVPLSTPQSKEAFRAAFTRLLALFKGDGNPAVFVRSSFIADPTKGVMQEVAKAAGVVYVDQTHIGDDRLNRAYSEPYYKPFNAFNGHPGDRGMAAIAESLYSSIVACSLTVPEPEPPMATAGRRAGGWRPGQALRRWRRSGR